MLQKTLCTLAIFGLSIGLAVGEEIKGARITKISESKITVQVGKKNDKKTTEYDLAKDFKLSKSEGKNKVVALEGGVKNEAFQNIDAKRGIQAKVVVTEGKVTEVVLGGKKKKKDTN